MHNHQQHFKKEASSYAMMLQRYARRLVEDETVAAKIVQEVLECQYDLNALVPSEHLRQVLKTDVLNNCYYHFQAKVFDWQLIKVPSRDYMRLPPDIEVKNTRDTN